MRETPPDQATTASLRLQPLPDADASSVFLVVGVGTSAARRKLLETLPTDGGMAFIKVGLLGARTFLTVCQETHFTPIEPDHLCIVPSDAGLSIVDGVLHVSRDLGEHGGSLACCLDDVNSAANLNTNPRIARLEQELATTRAELRDAVHKLETSDEDRKAISEQALSAEEEYRSRNEALTALNSQLQETLETQRTTSDDLQNVLYSTDVATLFLDENLAIRFFTPAAKALFAIIASDLGRPLSDLDWLAADADLLADARTVMRTQLPIKREVEAQNGACYKRRVLPYRTHDNKVEGVVITFVDITDRRQAANELGVAKRDAEQANAAKSRFLAAASHDLRQPLQTLSLVQGLLAKNVQTDKARRLVSRMDLTLGAMSGMLNALLDINQIEAGTVHADLAVFSVNDTLEQLRDEFAYHAQAKGVVLRVVPCTVHVHSDPRLLEQMVRNLVSNALKYTQRGKILLGCRRHHDKLRIEIWDTGIGIAEDQLQSIFEEYHQIDNAARERTRGLGLGLSIVNRLSLLLDHPVHVRSVIGHGSVFSIDVACSGAGTIVPRPLSHSDMAADLNGKVQQTGTILVVEDDPDVRESLEAFLKDAGHHVITATDAADALNLLKLGVIKFDLILADYNLPNGMDGVKLTVSARHVARRALPSIILTGDISTKTLGIIALEDCVLLTKPVKLKELTQALQRLLPRSADTPQIRLPRVAVDNIAARTPITFVVDDDDGIRETIRGVLEDDGRIVQDFATCESFLEAFRPGREACLVIDAYLPGMSGLTLLEQLHDAGHRLPAIMITGNSDVPIAVQAMKAGASDFIEKPISRHELLACVDRALDQARDEGVLSAWHEDAASHVACLTARQRQVMEMVLAGQPSKNIAADLGISQRTVENHRASIMHKMGTRSLPALARLALAAQRAPSRE